MKKYVIAFLIWVIIIPIAILNGGFREYVLVKLGGLEVEERFGAACQNLLKNISFQKKAYNVFYAK